MGFPNNKPVISAFTLLEIVAASAMLAVLLTSCVQMLRAISIHQRASDRRIVAMEAVQAVADEAANISWDQLTADSAKKINVPKPLSGHLPGAKLSISLEDENMPAASKRIHIELTWNGQDGQPVAPVQLTTWAFPDRPRTE
jgi:hypothetical protein